MSDLYNIPNDDGKTYRLKKFVEYQHEVPSIHYRFMGEWIKQNDIDLNRAVDFCWYMASSYNEITCIILDELINNEKLEPETIWELYKEQLDFGSARKYVKNNNYFVPLMKQWKALTKNEPYKWLISHNNINAEVTCKKIQNSLKKIKFVGRFASDLFIESIIYLKEYFKLNIKQSEKFEWKQCANLTSGIFNIFYEDEKANLFDKNGVISKKDEYFLTVSLLKIQKEIHKTYPEQDYDITMFVGKVCSFRNLFKSARYGGFHHDRQLGIIKKYEKTLPKYEKIYKECYELRKKIFDERFLGELHDWEGIRKERKKLWLTTGLTGAEK